MVQKYPEKATSPKKQKKEETKTKKGADSGNCALWLLGRMHIEEGRTVGRKAAASMKAKKNENETKQNKRNTRERQQHDIRPEDTGSHHTWLINYGERNSTSPLALGYPLLGPFGRSGILLHAVVQPWLSLQRSISP